ncbi:MAG TPA: hypothetical protein VN428_14110 [Bryobacteraceae bacterium]|nr:hypothetical protein [Bryobacteraceae bacterium]
MKWLKDILARIAAFFGTGRAKTVFDTVADYTAKALPFVELGAEIVAGLTPTRADDAALAFLRAQYPSLFDGTIKDGETLKRCVFDAVSALFHDRYPQLTDSMARAAVQLAVVGTKTK